MKITAVGWGRSVVGEHKVLTTKSSNVKIDKTGVVKITGKSHELALSGHFQISVEFDPDDLNALSAAAIRAPLEGKIEDLKTEIRSLKKTI